MDFLADLWLPILVASVFVFLASSVLHMLIPIHKGDFQGLPSEGELMAAMREQGVQRGNYVFPYASSMKELGTPEMREKYDKGPVGFLSVLPNGPPAMGKSLVQWYLFSLAVSTVVAYAAMLALAPGAEYMAVFRFTGTVAFLGYASSAIPDSIWKGQSWGTAAKYVFDGIVYGLVTAGALGWLWPAAA